MLHFEYPFLLLLLLLIPPMMVYERWYRGRQAQNIALFGGWQALMGLIPELKKGQAASKFRGSMIALACLIVALAHPRKGLYTQATEVKAADVYLAIDVSESMRAKDVVPSRMTRACQLATKLVDHLSGNRIGLVFFAGQAFLQMPLSTDSEAAKLFIQGASPDFDIEQGTAMESVIELILKVSASGGGKTSKTLLFLTDGENHSNKVLQSVSRGLENGIVSYVLGLGTVQGATIPIVKEGMNGFKRDRNGQKIISKMNKTMLQEIADAGGGAFYDANHHNDALLNTLKGVIDNNQTTLLVAQQYDSYESYFQYFVALALFLLLYTFVKADKK